MLFLTFSTTNVSKYSTIIPKIVPSFSPLLSCFFVSKSNPNLSQNPKGLKMRSLSPSGRLGLVGELQRHRGTALQAPEAAEHLLIRGPLRSRSHPGVSPGCLRGGLWDTSGRLVEVPESVFVIQIGVSQKSDAKVPYFNFMDQFPASLQCYKNLCSMSLFHTRVVHCDIRSHCKSLVRVI